MPFIKMNEHVAQILIPTPMSLLACRSHFVSKRGLLLVVAHPIDEFPHLLKLSVGSKD